MTSQNSLATSLLVTGALIQDEPHRLELALDMARYIVDTHLVDGELRYSSLAEQVGDSPTTAEDHDTLANVLAVLVGATGGATQLRYAEVLYDQAVELFGADDGGFLDAVASELFVCPRSLTDNATPSGTNTLVWAL